jgi:hypothetical protein
MNTTPNQAADEQISTLLQAMAQGDSAALLALYDKTGARLFELMTRASDDGAATEAALLDTYTQLWRQAGTWVESPSFLRLAIYIEEMIRDTDPGVTPPAYLRDMLATRIEREPQRPGNEGVVLPDERGVEHFRSAKPSSAAPAQLRIIFLWVIAGTCALIAGVAGYRWMQAERFLDRAILRQKEIEATGRKEQESLRSELERSHLSDQKIGQINTILATRGSRVIGLVPQSPGTDLAQVVFLDAPHNRCVIAGHIRPAPEGMAYQVWFGTLMAYVSAGLVKPDSADMNFATLAIDAGLQKLNSIMITLEPEGGSKQPTMPPIAFGRVSQ